MTHAWFVAEKESARFVVVVVVANIIVVAKIFAFELLQGLLSNQSEQLFVSSHPAFLE